MESVEEQKPPSQEVERSIAGARDGSFAALGQLLDQYRDYLLRIANEELHSDLARKVAPSDVVQETFLQAVRDFPKFVGGSEQEFRQWLRKSLLHNIQDAVKRFHGAQMRDPTRETPLAANDGEASLLRELASQDPSPSSMLIASQDMELVWAAIGRLPEDQRQIFEMRSFERRSFKEIGAALERSEDAVRMMWTRTVEKLLSEFPTNESSERRP